MSKNGWLWQIVGFFVIYTKPVFNIFNKLNYT